MRKRTVAMAPPPRPTGRQPRLLARALAVAAAATSLAVPARLAWLATPGAGGRLSNLAVTSDDAPSGWGRQVEERQLLVGKAAVAQAETAAALSDRAAAATPPVFTYYGVNSFALEIGGRRLLVDPLLVGDLVFYGQRWAFAGARRQEALDAAATLAPEEVEGRFDAIVLSQGLEDHAHPPTLQRIGRRTPIIASPRAAAVARELGFESVSVLEPGQSIQLGPHLRLTAVPGSVVGPPWEEPENGYVFTDLRPGGLSLGAEPHGNFLGPALGTSFRLLPQAPPVKVDALLVPLTAQDIGSYRFVNGPEEAAKTLEALKPVPRFVLPLRNGEINIKGALGGMLEEKGTVQDFQELVRQRPGLNGVKVLDVVPGQPVRLE